MKVKVLLPSSHQNTPVSTLLQSITPWGTRCSNDRCNRKDTYFLTWRASRLASQQPLCWCRLLLLLPSLSPRRRRYTTRLQRKRSRTKFCFIRGSKIIFYNTSVLHSQSHSEEGDLKTDVGTTTNTNVHVVYAFLTFLSLRLSNMLDAL